MWQVGLDLNHMLTSHQTRVHAYDALRLGTSRTPRFRDANVDGLTLADAFPSLGGVLCDARGRISALWASFIDQGDNTRTFYGLPNLFFEPMLASLRAGELPMYPSLGVEFDPIGLARASERGLSTQRQRQIVSAFPSVGW